MFNTFPGPQKLNLTHSGNDIIYKIFRRKNNRLFRKNKLYIPLRIAGKLPTLETAKKKKNEKERSKEKEKIKRNYFFVQLVNPHEKTSDLLR